MLRIGHTDHRRAFLRVASAASLASITGNALSAPDRQIAKPGHSVIFVYLHGGPSQFETFDPKPDAPTDIRSVLGTLPTAVPGLRYSEHFPMLASRANRFLTVRSFVPGDANHDLKPLVCAASGMANLGALHATVGGVQNSDGLPNNIYLTPKAIGEKKADPFMGPNALLTGAFARSTGPFVPGGDGELLRDMRLAIPAERLAERRALLTAVDNTMRELDESGADGTRERALRVLTGSVADAFDLRQEPQHLLDRYDTAGLVAESAITTKWNNHLFYKEHVRSLGKLMLMSRRLVERGAGFVALNTAFVWDNHSDVNNAPMKEAMPWLAPVLDKALAALLDDLEARSLSDRVMVVVCGEMGRTPRVNNKGGRDHWGGLGPMLLAGGPARSGGILGSSARDGGAPSSAPVTISNLLGSIFGHLWDVPKLRLRADLGRDLSRVASYDAIPGLG
jgi:hypothetical protein